jgi:hypothetical protein
LQQIYSFINFKKYKILEVKVNNSFCMEKVVTLTMIKRYCQVLESDFYFIFSLPVTKWQGELLWSLFVRPSVSRPSVRRPSVNFYFKWHLLINHSANFIQTSQECSFGSHLWKLFKEFNSMQNSGCHGNRKKIF